MMQNAGSSIYGVDHAQLRKDLNRLKGEWAIFNDPRIKLGSKMQSTSALMAALRFCLKNPQATFQLVLTHTFEYLKGVNTVEGANYFNSEMLRIIHETASCCAQALNYVAKAEQEEFEPLESRSVAQLAQETFRIFSQSRRHFSVLKQTFANEDPSDYRKAYLEAYDAIMKRSDQVCTDLMGQFLAKVREGKLSSQIYIKKAVEKFQVLSHTQPKTIDAEGFNLLDSAIQEFFQSAYTLQTKLVEIETVFNSHRDMPEEDAALLQVQKCKELRAIVTEFVHQMYEATEEPLKKLYADPSIIPMTLFSQALDAVFASDIGQKFLAELTSINSTLTIARIAKMNNRFIDFLPKGTSVTKNPCWQSSVFQAATSRLMMPLGEMLKQLKSFQLPQETLDPLIKVYQQLHAIALVSQALSPGESSAR